MPKNKTKQKIKVNLTANHRHNQTTRTTGRQQQQQTTIRRKTEPKTTTDFGEIDAEHVIAGQRHREVGGLGGGDGDDDGTETERPEHTPFSAAARTRGPYDGQDVAWLRRGHRKSAAAAPGLARERAALGVGGTAAHGLGAGNGRAESESSC